MFLLLDKYNLKQNKNNNIILNKIKKLIGERKLFINIENIYHKFIDYNDKFLNIMRIISFTMIILIKLFILYLSADLYYNIEDYVVVYNYLKKINNPSFLLLFTISNRLNTINKYRIYSSKLIYKTSLNRFIFSEKKINNTI